MAAGARALRDPELLTSLKWLARDSDGALNVACRAINVRLGLMAAGERFDETIRAEELCDAEELVRLRQLLDQQLQALHHATPSKI